MFWVRHELECLESNTQVSDQRTDVKSRLLLVREDELWALLDAGSVKMSRGWITAGLIAMLPVAARVAGSWPHIYGSSPEINSGDVESHHQSLATSK